MNFETTRLKSKAALLLACIVAISPVTMKAQASSTPTPAPQTDPSRHDHAAVGGQHSPEKQLEWMTAKLSLTPDQVTQIKAIQADGMQQREAIHADPSLARPEKHAKMMAIHETQQEKVKAVLNDQQKVQYDAILTKRRERHDRHPEGTPAVPPA